MVARERRGYTPEWYRLYGDACCTRHGVDNRRFVHVSVKWSCGDCVYGMKAYGVMQVWIYSFLTWCTRWGCVVSFTTRGIAPRTLWIEVWVGYIHVLDEWEMSFLSRPSVEPRFFGSASCSLVTVLTPVSRLPNFLLAVSNNKTGCSETLTDCHQVKILKRCLFQFIWNWRNVLFVTV